MPTLYEYDAMGNVVKQTLALAEQPSPENSPITETSFGAESLEDGVYSITTTTRYNAAGQPLISVQKRLISQLSPTQESKSVFVSERSLTSMQWGVYNEATKRTQYSTVPTSNITAEAVTVDGFALSQKKTAGITSYQANALNQYTMLSVDDITDFIPSYDAAGNQTRVKTSTGIWAISYDAENRPTDFTKVDSSGSTSIHCEYDHMGRRATKKVTVNGSISLHQRYIYRDYLQIAALDLTRAAHPALWYITWAPTQPIATRPLAIQKDGTWFAYGWDLTKNICEVYGPAGYIRTAYTYAPYGEVTSEGDVIQPIQWSSEYNDTELGLVYYNYRHYNPVDGRWMGRDLIAEQSHSHLYIYSSNNCVLNTDLHGLMYLKTNGVPKIIVHNSSERRGPGIVATTSKFILKDAPKIGNCKLYYDKTKNKYFITYPSVSYVPVIHFYKINSANAKSIDDPIPDSIYNTYRKHEMVHVEILSRNWNILVDELSLLKEGLCSKKEAETAIELAEQIYIVRYYISQLENNDFDWRDYGYNSDNQIKLSIISSNQQAKSNIANAISKISSNSYAQKNGYDYSSLRYELI